MLYGAEIAVCFEINTKQMNTVWAECQFLNVESVGAGKWYRTLGYLRSLCTL